MLSLFRKNQHMPSASDALPGRNTAIQTSEFHFINGRPLKCPYPDGMQFVLFGMGCFWGVERLYWSLDGVWVTSVGYAGGHTLNPTYQEVCSGLTGHNEVTQIIFDPNLLSFEDLLILFWENHDPTQAMRQGNDIGTQYRSGIYCYDDKQLELAFASRKKYSVGLAKAGHGPITTEILMAPSYYFAEDYHQQYLAKIPGGYCSMRGTGVACTVT